jgi:hypothetical protein
MTQASTPIFEQRKPSPNFSKVLPHPTYSSNTAPSDFHLPVPLKNSIRRRKFRDDNDITAELQTWLQNTPENSYQQSIQALGSTRREVIEKDEHYAEKQRL